MWIDESEGTILHQGVTNRDHVSNMLVINYSTENQCYIFFKKGSRKFDSKSIPEYIIMVI
ncbi:hypothetical protein SAMN05421841_1982 [Chryseobacterium wanjuense]|uniref:Uncharacterized protein n=1 Tax=Chryseobacterium wanjuense TaxID=356305 RepID=A0A1I0QLP6_9FLAO|nr:hypothetical protein SAMN05421841_1982 [Chryseobacterium wanjuense]